MKQTDLPEKRPPEWVYPLALLVLALLTYGPFLSQLGFYWDDWVFAWKRIYLGAPGLIDEFAKNRPLRGYTEPFFTPFFGVNPLAWQIYALFVRWLAASLFWYFLRSIWPERRVGALLAAALFLVYPGFTQQPLAMTYHYFWFSYVALFLSLILMLHALQSARFFWIYLVLALLLSGFQLFASEYMVSLELLRPVFLWLALSATVAVPKERLKRVIWLEAPFAVVLGLYLLWRLVWYETPMYSPALPGENTSVNSVLSLVEGVVKVLATVNLNAWLQTIQLPDFSQLGVLFIVVYLVAVIGLFAGWLFFARRIDSNLSKSASVEWDWLLLGLGGMILASLPFLLAGLPFRLVFPEDRFILSFLPFVGLFVAALIDLIPNSSNRYLAAGLILALAVNFQFQVLLKYRDDWKVQKNFVWQLAWRAPKLGPGTTILSEDYDTFAFNDDESFTPILNWTYIPTETELPYTYRYAFISLRMSEILPEMLKTADSAQSPMLVTRYAPPACLHVFDPRYDDALLSLPQRGDVTALSTLNLPVIPDLTRQAVPLSHPSQTLSGTFSATPPTPFGAEPEHRWCYYYLKADLARQSDDWQAVARLGDEAFAIPYLPDDSYEYLPFIEAYARLGRIKDARTLTRQVAETTPLLRPALCSLWSRVPNVPVETADEIRQELQICPVKK